MPAALLLKVQDLSQAMGSSDYEASEVLQTVISAIERATVRVEALMHTRLRASSGLDKFQVTSRAGEPLDGMYRLQLSMGNLKEDPVITYGESSADEGSPVSGADVLLGKGVVLLPASYLGKHVRVQFRAGFLSAAEVPAEIRQALICFTPVSLLAASGTQIELKVLKPAMDRATSLEVQGLQILSAIDRRVGAALKPSFSSLTLLQEW